MAYTPTNWQNLPNTTTPVIANSLNNMETGIKKSDTVIGGDEYDSTATYEIGDFCIYNNKLYRCTTAISTAEAFTPAHWEETSITEELQSGGKIIDDMDTSESQIVNAPSIHAVKDYVEDRTEITSYTITDLPDPSGPNSYELKKIGNLVVLNVANIWMNSLSSNTWTKIGEIPSSIRPNISLNSAGIVVRGDNGVVQGYAKCEVKHDTGYINIRSSTAVTIYPGVSFSCSWILD